VVGTRTTSQLDDGFLRDADGAITTFNVPGAVVTLPVSMNARGIVVGSYTISIDPALFSGFLRSKAGTFTLFDFPGGMATTPASINASNVITGYYYNGHDVLGFLRLP